MPTPFSHLATAQQLRDDPQLPAAARDLIARELPAFLLGNIAADARISGNVAREATHFFSYDLPIEQHPWRVMLAKHPALQTPINDVQRAFLAGYTAHLAMDELWSLEMVRPHFVAADWGDRRLRFLMLHIILIYMDEQDYARVGAWQRDSLLAAQPEGWTPFLNDTTLADWRDFIGAQLPPGSSQTLEVFGERISVPPAMFRAILDNPAQMHADLWQHIPQEFLATTQRRMYDHSREQMVVFLDMVTDAL
jgi:hypothetical protein